MREPLEIEQIDTGLKLGFTIFRMGSPKSDIFLITYDFSNKLPLLKIHSCISRQ